MKISSRGLNEGERFCCSKKDLKIFSDVNISINFASYSRSFDDEKMSKHKRFKGKIVAKLVINNRDVKPDFFIESAWPSMTFYVLKSEEFSEELKQTFVSSFLPKMRTILDKHGKNNPDNTSGYYTIFIELLNGVFCLHERVNKC